MSHDDGRDRWAHGQQPGPDHTSEAAYGSGPGNAWAAPGEEPPAPAGDGWSVPGGGSGGAPGHGHAGYGGRSGPGPAPPPGYGRPWAPRPGVVTLRPMNIGDIFNGAFGYIRDNPKAALGLALIVTALSSIPSAVGSVGYLLDTAAGMQDLADDPYGPGAQEMPVQWWSIATMYGGFLVDYIGQIVLVGLLSSIVGLAVLGRRLTMREALGVARRRLPALFGVALLLLLLSLLWTGLVVGLVFGAIALGVLVHPGVGVVAALAGFPLLVVLAVWVYVRTALAMPVAVLERTGPGGSLARSWRLTRRSWWRVFGLLLLSQFIVAIVVNLLATPFQFAAVGVGAAAPDAQWTPTVATALVYVGLVLAGALGTPFIVGVTTLIYIDLRMRREGLDLKLQTAAQSDEHIGIDVYVPDDTAAGAPAPAGPGSYGTGSYGTGGAAQAHPQYGQYGYDAGGYGRGGGPGAPS